MQLFTEKKTAEESVGPVMFSQLDEVIPKDWRKHKRYVKFKTLNEVIARDTKVIPYHERTDKRLSYLQNKIVFA